MCQVFLNADSDSLQSCLPFFWGLVQLTLQLLDVLQSTKKAEYHTQCKSQEGQSLRIRVANFSPPGAWWWHRAGRGSRCCNTATRSASDCWRACPPPLGCPTWQPSSSSRNTAPWTGSHPWRSPICSGWGCWSKASGSPVTTHKDCGEKRMQPRGGSGKMFYYFCKHTCMELWQLHSPHSLRGCTDSWRRWDSSGASFWCSPRYRCLCRPAYHLCPRTTSLRKKHSGGAVEHGGQLASQNASTDETLQRLCVMLNIRGDVGLLNDDDLISQCIIKSSFMCLLCCNVVTWNSTQLAVMQHFLSINKDNTITNPPWSYL